MGRRRVILVTDGDYIAVRAVEEAARNVGGRCISSSGGNPTALTGYEIAKMIKSAKNDPVIVMIDDRGYMGEGSGERAADYIINDPEIEVMGVIAVASNTKFVEGVKVDYSIDRAGKIVNCAVDKHGNRKKDKILKGDTVDILNKNDVPVIVGLGDPGKMDGCDSICCGAPILTAAVEHIIRMNGAK